MEVEKSTSYLNKQASKNSIHILFFTVILATVFLLGHVSALFIYKDKSGDSDSRFDNILYGDKGEVLSPDDMDLFWEVYGQIRANYIDKDLPSKEILVESATKGLVSGLDSKYTNYYTKEEWEEIQQSNSGKFEGIGIKLMAGENYPIVETPIKGSPAQKAGIMPQDLIIEVEGKSTEKLSITKTAEMIRGEKGTKVKVKIFRPSSGETLELTIKRADIDIDSIEVLDLGDGGYMISISRFTESSYSEFQEQWLDAVEEVNKADADYLVLDLRNNTGGWVDAAKFVLGEFLPQGSVILKEVDRDGREEVNATEREGDLKDIPMVVLVNGGSASASEIVAGALQDMGRAKLVGKSTLGKGVEQKILPTSDGGTIHIVFKRWFTPKGHNLSSENALKPDKEIELTSNDVQSNKDPQLDGAKELLK